MNSTQTLKRSTFFLGWLVFMVRILKIRSLGTHPKNGVFERTLEGSGLQGVQAPRVPKGPLVFHGSEG